MCEIQLYALKTMRKDVLYAYYAKLVYYVPRLGNRILHSRVDCQHANIISYFPAEVRMLFSSYPRSKVRQNMHVLQPENCRL